MSRLGFIVFYVTASADWIRRQEAIYLNIWKLNSATKSRKNGQKRILKIMLRVKKWEL